MTVGGLASRELTKAEHLQLACSGPVAHRGLFTPHSEPENSFGAFERAVSLGFGFECDVRLSADGVVYAFHDDDLLRLTGTSGRFADFCAEQLDQLTLQDTKENPPRLSEVLERVAGRVPVVIELKTFDAQEGWLTDGKTEAALLDVCAGYGGALVLKSFNPHTVLHLLEEQSRWPVGLISCDASHDPDLHFVSSREAVDLASLTHPSARRADFISYSIRDLTESVRQARNTPYFAWTVRTPQDVLKARARAVTPIFEKGVLEMFS